MAYERIKELGTLASDAQHSGNFERAAEYGTLIAYHSISLGDWEYFEQVTGGMIRRLQRACLDFRLAGKTTRAQNRARQGILLAEDIRESLTETTAQRGITFEYEGDFRVMGGLDDHARPYQKARGLYEVYEQETNIGQRIGQMREESVHENTMVLRSLIDATEFDLDEDVKDEIYYTSLVTRIDFKLESLESIVADLLDRGEWRSAEDE